MIGGIEFIKPKPDKMQAYLEPIRNSLQKPRGGLVRKAFAENLRSAGKDYTLSLLFKSRSLFTPSISFMNLATLSGTSFFQFSPLSILFLISVEE